jgi:hypothetical protein
VDESVNIKDAILEYAYCWRAQNNGTTPVIEAEAEALSLWLERTAYRIKKPDFDKDLVELEKENAVLRQEITALKKRG